jgi:hypothetical protein
LPVEKEGFLTLQNFLETHRRAPVVVVQSLGFVGSVVSFVVANTINGNYTVIGVDQDNETGRRAGDSLNAGIFSIVVDDPKIKKYFEVIMKRCNFYAMVDPAAYVAGGGCYNSCINLDVSKEVQKNMLWLVMMDRF